MNKPLLKALLILLFSEIILVTLSFISPEINIPLIKGKTIDLKFLRIEELIDFSFKKKNNLMAENLIQTYSFDDSLTIETILKRRPLTFTEKKTVDNHFINPVDSNGNYALDFFFKALHELDDTTIVRIAHYGDSQLEGDRLTCFLRTFFQQEFGGSGIGYVPLTDITSHVYLTRNSSLNWRRYTVFHDPFKNNYYGAAGIVFNFLNMTYGHLNSSNYLTPGTVNIDFEDKTNYDHISVLYGKAYAPCKIDCYDNLTSQKISSDTLSATNPFNIKKLKIPANTQHLKFEFISSISPDLYGISFEGKNGVQIDNYSIRGHSGDGLLKIETNFLGLQLKQLNTHLVILQYGANLVPYITSDASCTMIEQFFYELFLKFKNACPGICILVISTGDMTNYMNGENKSYPFIPKIRDAQKRAALRAGCAFWDLFEAMGGANSITTWAEKGFASKNGHFYRNGQEIVAKELFQTLMNEYHIYLYRQKKNSFVQAQ